MKFNIKKLNQKGFDHVMALLAFIVVFAGIGTYLVVKSHAATPVNPTYVELTLNGNRSVCLAGSALGTCTTSDREMLYVKPVAGTSNFQLKTENGLCIDDWNHAYQKVDASKGGTNIRARFNTCNSSPNQQWSWRGNGSHELANHGNNYQGCLNAKGNRNTPGTPVIIYACQDTWNERWYEVSQASAGNPKPWGLTGTTTQSSPATGKVTFTSSITNTAGPAATGTFRYGPRYFYSSTATPTKNPNGGYSGEIASAGGDRSYTGLKAGSSLSNITQTVTVPSGESSAYICGTVYYSPQSWNSNTSGRSPAVCVSVPTILGTAQ